MWKWSDRMQQKPYWTGLLNPVLCQLNLFSNFSTVFATDCKEDLLEVIIQILFKYITFEELQWYTIEYPFARCAYYFIAREKIKFEFTNFWFTFTNRFTWLVTTEFLRLRLAKASVILFALKLFELCSLFLLFFLLLLWETH